MNTESPNAENSDDIEINSVEGHNAVGHSQRAFPECHTSQLAGVVYAPAAGTDTTGQFGTARNYTGAPDMETSDIRDLWALLDSVAPPPGETEPRPSIRTTARIMGKRAAKLACLDKIDTIGKQLGRFSDKVGYHRDYNSTVASLEAIIGYEGFAPAVRFIFYLHNYTVDVRADLYNTFSRSWSYDIDSFDTITAIFRVFEVVRAHCRDEDDEPVGTRYQRVRNDAWDEFLELYWEQAEPRPDRPASPE
jgi:hypothetical protein